MTEHNELDATMEQKPAPRSRKGEPRLTSMKVFNCAKLNLRNEPEAYGEVIATLNKDQIVKVDKSFKHPEFSKVKVNGIEGYAMTAYLSEL